MKAVTFKEFGNVDVLQVTEMQKPAPKAGEVLVEVHATAINPADAKIRQGHLAEVFPVSFPHILGGDVAGVVREVGAGVSDVAVGDEVFFGNPLNAKGGYAEYVTVAASLVAKKPNSLSFEQAAALPVTAYTALQTLRDFSSIKAGDKVLIHAGSGGVGSMAIPYAKSRGATVYTTTSSENIDYVKALGADVVIDYRTEDFLAVAQAAGGMDIVLETIGGDNYRKSILATKDGGSVPCIVAPPDAQTKALAASRDIKTDFFLLDLNRRDLETIADLAAKKVLRPKIAQVYALHEVQAAHRQIESGRTVGKLVLKLR